MSNFLYDGRVMTLVEFQRHVQEYDFGAWPPSMIVLHHTYRPDVSWAPGDDNPANDWDKLPRSEMATRMSHIKDYYQQQLGWNRGPHLFVTDRYVGLMTPMYHWGIHANAGNMAHYDGRIIYSLGIEVVGYYDHVRWPEPVERMVGGIVAALHARLGTFNIEYRPPRHSGRSSFYDHDHSIAMHRDFTTKTCPGTVITPDYFIPVLIRERERFTGSPSSGCPSVPTTARITTESDILHSPHRVTAERALARMLDRDNGEYTPFDVEWIVTAYAQVCAQAGVDLLVALAQMCHETDYLSSWWAARPRRNPAGLGVTGEPGAGLSFASWDDSIRAHVGRLVAYAVPPHRRSPVQQSLSSYALSVRHLPPSLHGTALTIADLTHKWATDPDYAVKLVHHARYLQEG